MKYLEIILHIEGYKPPIYFSRDTNFDRLSLLGLLFRGSNPTSEVIQWLESESTFWSHNYIYLDKITPYLVQIGVEWEINEEPASVFYIERNNFIEIMKEYNKLSKKLLPMIIFELDPNTHLLSCREATSAELLREPDPNRVKDAKEFLKELAEEREKRKFLEIVLRKDFFTREPLYFSYNLNYDPFYLLTFIFNGDIIVSNLIEWAESDNTVFYYEKVYLKKIENTVKLGFENEIDIVSGNVFCINKNNFIELLQEFDKLSKNLTRLIVIELFPQINNYISCREGTEEELKVIPDPEKFEYIKQLLINAFAQIKKPN